MPLQYFYNDNSKIVFFKLYYFCHAKVQYIKSNNHFLEHGFEKKVIIFMKN